MGDIAPLMDEMLQTPVLDAEPWWAGRLKLSPKNLVAAVRSGGASNQSPSV